MLQGTDDNGHGFERKHSNIYQVTAVEPPICFVEVHVLFVICNYLHMLVSNTFSISDDVCVINCSMTCMTSGAGITCVHLGAQYLSFHRFSHLLSCCKELMTTAMNLKENILIFTKQLQ
jgi:hypothetical protein